VEFNQQHPLHVLHKPEFSLPYVGDGLTGLKIISYLAVAVDILSGFQITDRQIMGGFSEWLIPARKFAEERERGTKGGKRCAQCF
jgi:hypothetical protein